jgi:hypothetical protein
MDTTAPHALKEEMPLRENKSQHTALTVELLDIGRTLVGFPCLESA